MGRGRTALRRARRSPEGGGGECCDGGMCGVWVQCEVEEGERERRGKTDLDPVVFVVVDDRDGLHQGGVAKDAGAAAHVDGAAEA